MVWLLSTISIITIDQRYVQFESKIELIDQLSTVSEWRYCVVFLREWQIEAKLRCYVIP